MPIQWRHMSKKRLILLLYLGLLLLGNGFVGIASALATQDAERYAPILYFENQETCYPINVSYAIENSYLYEVDNPTPISTSPNASMLAGYTTPDKYYLDNQKGTVNDNGIVQDYQSKMISLGFEVYAHVDTINSVIQYWFFYAFNSGELNHHEGDWEMIQILFSNDQPTQVMFSQHYSGQKATWSQVDKDGDHVKDYVARGSHANYIKPYSGKVGLASDFVGDNGMVLRPTTDYRITMLNGQPWLQFAGRWGAYGVNTSQATEATILGEAGPEGPEFREGGTMWNQPLAWGGNLPSANDYLFILEWFVYNFVTLFILFTVLSLLLLVFFVYRCHKRYGLGPRKFSLLYMDGVNTKSIGNILCIVAIIIALFGLIYPWYAVVANITVPPYRDTGAFNMISIDGLNGIQIQLPNRAGPVPLGTFALPFYIIIAIGLVFLILATIGVSQSKKLGKKYLLRGIRLLIPFILILIVIMSVGWIVSTISPVNIKGNTDVFSAANAVSAAPFGGQYTIQISGVDGGSVSLQWGFGIGAYLLLFAGIILLMAGLVELAAHVKFFEEKEPEPPKSSKHMKQKEPGEEEKE